MLIVMLVWVVGMIDSVVVSRVVEKKIVFMGILCWGKEKGVWIILCFYGR